MPARFDIQWIRAAANQACLRPMLPDAFNNGLKCAFIAEISRAEMPKQNYSSGSHAVPVPHCWKFVICSEFFAYAASKTFRGCH